MSPETAAKDFLESESSWTSFSFKTVRIKITAEIKLIEYEGTRLRERESPLSTSNGDPAARPAVVLRGLGFTGRILQ